MTRAITVALFCCAAASGADPVRSVWITSPETGGPVQSRPEVHSVALDGDFIVVKSAGISLKYFGRLQQAPVPSEKVREFVYRIPLHPEPETGRHARVPVDVIGAFVNGLPIYNHEESVSWNGANLWHYDTVASSGAPTGLLEQLPASSSPLIGFALDGYPIYGPSGMRSSYRLLPITQRHILPGGIELTPEQYGPDVTPANPIGTFAEDYEYVTGEGDLDEFNGRFIRTREYPNGTYAYFLTKYPYLIGPRYYGRIASAGATRWSTVGTKRLTLSVNTGRIEAGSEIRFRLEARDSSGEPIRDFEYVHTEPIHFVIVSADLEEFDHIHPGLAADDSYQVACIFPRAGRYRVWADYSLPGEPPHVDSFDIDVKGNATLPPKPASVLKVEVLPSKPLRAGEDIPIALRIAGNVSALEPYLGAWSHVILVGPNLNSFAHLHPVENIDPVTPAHTHNVSGPPPNTIHIVANFPSPGIYKLWAQFQRAGEVQTVPFTLDVASGAAPASVTRIPAGAITIRVTEHGYDPATVAIPAGKPVTLAFRRDSTTNCGSEVVFPSLGIRKPIAPGGTVLIQLPAQPAGELSFSCGLGMYRGATIARAVTAAAGVRPER